MENLENEMKQMEKEVIEQQPIDKELKENVNVNKGPKIVDFTN